MRNLIDTIFAPVLGWLSQIYTYLVQATIPASQPLKFSLYFNYFAPFGWQWQLLIQTVCTLGFIYIVIYIVFVHLGLYQKFKDAIPFL